MKLFVTGATGFIGSHFVQQALEAGHAVTALRRSPVSQPRIPLATQPIWLEKPMDAVTVKDFADHDVLVHLAAHGMTPQPATWKDCFNVNVIQSLNLALIAVKAEVGRIICSGSYAEYGQSGLRYDFIPSNAPLEPTDIYASSKAAGFMALYTLAVTKGVQLSYHRIFSAFGEGQFAKNFWPALRCAALAGEDLPMTHGEQIRDFIAVELVAQRLLHACADPSLQPGAPQVKNLGSGKPQSLREFAEYWWQHWNASGQLIFGAIPYRDHEVMRYVPEVDAKHTFSLGM